ncbi:TPA: transcriptional regulator [Clostridioides difficile]|nr:transcriptional regulator [Clostridioides difficile]MBY2757201.1 transcriptional regulator [Clostridioides difficile]MDN9172632.1 transcriptional regulator [Clostridioides difficile]HBG1230859.1 transcriptional regulator [Clostridioides difficile]
MWIYHKRWKAKRFHKIIIEWSGVMSDLKSESFKRAENKLYSYNRVKTEIKNLNLEIEEKENLYMGCCSIGYGEKSGTTYNISNLVESEVLKKEKEVEKIKRHIKVKEIFIEKIDNAILLLNEDEIALIKHRYFSNKKNSWNYVAKKIGFSTARCKQMRIEIINKLKDLLS